MKKISILVCLVFIVIHTVTMASEVRISINGKDAILEVELIKEENVILGPARAIAENIGASAVWHAKSKKLTINKGQTCIDLYVDSKMAYINGDPKKLAVAPKIIDNSIMVPIRFIIENLGLDVKWNKDIVTISSDETKIVRKVENLCEQIKQQQLSLTSHKNSYGTLYIGENDKEFLIGVLKNNVKVDAVDTSRTSGIQCRYMISVGNIELGYNGALCYEENGYVYIFYLNEDDKISRKGKSI